MSIQLIMSEVMEETLYLPEPAVSVETAPLAPEQETEVIAFLAERPVHTVIMAGLIRDNGLVSPLNRGVFYGCRNSEGRLEGVALIGHATLFDARTHRALQEFALYAQLCRDTHVLLGEADEIERFWNFYADEGQPMRRICRELLFEMRDSPSAHVEVENLRFATPDDLELVMPVQAQMAYAKSGVNPMEVDPEGFRARCLRRIEKRRTWVLVEEGRLIFKAENQSDTPDVIYLEGVYVAPWARGKGIGRECLTALSADLLTRTKSVCLLVNECNERAHAFYRLSGYKLRGVYDTIFLEADGR